MFLACSPYYIAGGFVALFMNVKQNQLHILKHFLWCCLRSYAGLVLDCFVFPQVLLNIFLNSKESALSWSFYLGIAFMRVLPHAYDLYRAKTYDPWSSKFSIDPHASFFSGSLALRTSSSVLYVCYLLQSSACSSSLADDVSFQEDLGDMKIMRKF